MKRFLSVLLVLILCLQLLPVGSFAADESGSPKHIPRVVSIVFDDSGSMYNGTDRWAYISYSMQAFAAMMGSDDMLFVTYLNNTGKSGQVNLSDGAKDSTVSGFTSIRFGGGTPDRLAQGAGYLVDAYGKFGANANYYLVVMTDGDLDSGDLPGKVKNINTNTAPKLKGAEFETVYFTMNPKDENLKIDGVKVVEAFDTNLIVAALKDVSADIMGRTTISHKVSGGKLSFSLSYPALSIAVVAQKANGNFADFKATAQLGGKDFDCKIGNYPVITPDKIIKNYNYSVFNEKHPQNPPSGVVSLITNGGVPLAKGNYTVDLSGYDLKADDIVVLVEPAVRIGCKYFINDSKNAISFEDLKNTVQEGDNVTVECGLYELNPDGSLGDPVPESTLSPDYKILVNGQEVGVTAGSKNTYKFQIKKEFEEQELQVQALLKGYQPFVLKENFGKFQIKITPVTLPQGAELVKLTKPTWQQWLAGSGEITFQLQEMDDSVLGRTAIVVEGCEGFPTGACTDLGAAVRVEGNNIVYVPKAELDFDKLPDSFVVGLKELATGQVVMKKTVQVVRPSYRIAVENELSDKVPSLDELKVNTAGITFTITVDYEGTGIFTPLAQWDLGMVDKLAITSGDLPGKTETVLGSDGNPAGKKFTPQYDEMNNNGIPFTKVAGRVHIITAALQDTNTTGETKVETLAPDYDIVVYKENITMTNTTLAVNTEYVEFLILRDGKNLNRLELEGLAPYQLSYDQKQSRMAVEASVYTYPDGTSVLRCTPGYKGKCFPSREMNWWALFTLFTLDKIDMHMVLTLGGDVAKAAVTVQNSPIGWISLLSTAAIIVLILHMIWCYISRVRFLRGEFYTVMFKEASSGDGYTIMSVDPVNPHRLPTKLLSGSTWRQLGGRMVGLVIPRTRQRFVIDVEKKSANFTTDAAEGVMFRTYPRSIKEDNGRDFLYGNINERTLRAILEWDIDFEFRENILSGRSCANHDMNLDDSTYFYEIGSKSILLFVSRQRKKEVLKQSK